MRTYNGYEFNKKNAVTDVKTPREFVETYYKTSKITPHLHCFPDYKELLILSREKDLETDGYAVITHHESITGQDVALYS